MAHLQSVRIRGFKTFAKATELVFEPGVTVVIGPNGSGKSNIADAVLWVLGEQSPGNLRGRTMQDVMFSGADGKKMSSVAEVTLVFDNGSGRLPLDCAELEVTRRLTRESGSEYRLNGNSCRLVDIQDVVGALGLGREMHSVISQGKVESFLNSSAEARRAMVEEAAGLGRFKKRRERAQAKLERANQNLVRAQDIEEEVRAAMRPLRQQVAAAERFAKATEDWAAARARVLLHNLNETQEAHKKGTEELQKIEAGLSEVGGKVADLRRQRAEEEESFALALKARERVGGLFHQSRAAAEYLEGRTAALRQRLARAEGDLERARRRQELAQGEAGSLGSRLAQAMTGTVDEQRLARVEGWLEGIRREMDQTLPAYKEMVRQEEDLKDSALEAEAARSHAVQDRDFLQREKSERGRVTADLESLLGQTRARRSELEAEAAKLETAVSDGQTAVEQAGSEVRSASVARDEARSRAEEAAQREAGLAAVLAGVESRQSVLRGLLERKEGLPAGARELLANAEGFESLTEALSVRPGYERAVAAALGSLIEAVVVPKGRGLARVAVEVSGPFEAVAGSEHARADASGGAAPEGMVSLWEVVSGPEPLLRTLRIIVPQTYVLDSTSWVESGMADEVLESLGVSTQVVNRRGELLRGGFHAARREEAAAEALLAARNELEEARREHAEVSADLAGAGQATEMARAAMVEQEAQLRSLEEGAREAEHLLAAQRSESDLCRRRLEESSAQMEELLQRDEREKRATEELVAKLSEVEQTVTEKEALLETGRASLREVRNSLEAMRGTVDRLEDKKGQAALVEVKLRERCRTLAGERARVETQKERADRETAKAQRRVAFLERYKPVVADLLRVAERLAEEGKCCAERLATDVESTRTQTEGTAKVMRDWGSSEVELQRDYDGMTGRLTEVRVEQTRLEDRRVQLEEELGELRRRHLSPRSLTMADVAGCDAESLDAFAERAERRRDRIGPVNPLAEQEYGQMEERAQFLADQRADLQAAVGQLEEVIAGLDEHIARSFDEVFTAAAEHFATVISVVFPGAVGTLGLEEPKEEGEQPSGEEGEVIEEEVLEQEPNRRSRGVTLEVKFANKAPRSLTLLSGGEKAMTAIAFLFSLFLAKPCPFYILDEVEASLDDINIRRFLSLIRKYKEKTQFIIITHQRQTMEVADTLYGVALQGDGTSRVLSRKMNMAKGA